ncbi:MAG: hypothetical protein LH702_02470 [Phormidesmis sp. CAN_BIN44]|nr:hypothetical protein [Phormidesmis sp. CAN_BIN44]
MNIKDEQNQDETVKYSPNPQHRDNNPRKSQWTIMEDEEVQCFEVAYGKGWKKGDDAWGFHLKQNTVKYLGRGEDRSVDLFIAKFKNDASHNIWHGYPADHQKNSQDIPDTDILSNWIANDVLKKAKIRKIMTGQPCKL